MQISKLPASPEKKMRVGCPAHNCGGRCLLIAHIRDGRIVRLETDDRPDSVAAPQLRACVRGRSYLRRQYHPERLTRPLKRVGRRGSGEMRPSSWDEALDEVASQMERVMREYGNSGLFVPYGTGSYNQLNGSHVARRLMNLFGGCLGIYNSYSWAATNLATPTVYGLRPLSKRESRRIVEDVLQKVRDIPEDLRELVVTNAEGNPFYVEELIKMLIDEEVIIKGEQDWWVVPQRLMEIRIPPTLTGVLQARLDSLPAEERSLMQQASGVGRVFWDRALHHINNAESSGLDGDTIQSSLAGLSGKEMIYRRDSSTFTDAGEHIFKHAMLREVTYASVFKRTRRSSRRREGARADAVVSTAMVSTEPW